jgi:hypothetical protein
VQALVAARPGRALRTLARCGPTGCSCAGSCGASHDTDDEEEALGVASAALRRAVVARTEHRDAIAIAASGPTPAGAAPRHALQRAASARSSAVDAGLHDGSLPTALRRAVADRRSQAHGTRSPALLQRACGDTGIGPRECSMVSGTVAGTLIRFDPWCDTPAPGERAGLTALVPTIAATDRVAVHGFASEEGHPSMTPFNERLSCARAEAARDILVGAGCRAPIDVVAHGPVATDPRGGTSTSPSDRRSVVVQTRGPAPVPPPAPPRPRARSCGPDIGSQLTAVLTEIQRAFNDPSLSEWRRELACDNLVTPNPAAIMGWDILDLFLPQTSWLRSGRCGVPRIGTEDPAGCSNSVEVDGKCWLAGTVNYAMYGIACRLCSDRHRRVLPVGLDSWTQGDMELWVSFYNIADRMGGGIGPPRDWAVATYRGGPTARPARAGNRPSCPVGCTDPPSHTRFDFAWPPIRGPLFH